MSGPLRVPATISPASEDARVVEPSATERPWLLPALTLGLVFVLAFGFALGRRPVGLLTEELAASQDQVETLKEENGRLVQRSEAQEYEIARLNDRVGVLTPKCADGAGEVAQVKDFLVRGQPGVATSLAETALARRSNPLCPEARAALAGLWYESSMDALLSTPRPTFPDMSLDEQLVARYLEIERKAEDHEVAKEERWAPWSVASRAYNAGLWALSDAAFRRAWEAGEAGEGAITFRYALLRNWGHHLRDGGPAARERSARLLATAVAGAEAFDLPSGEACGDLKEMGYSDCRGLAIDETEPVLSVRSR